MVHATSLSNVKGYVDETGKMYKGWCFHETQGILPLRLRKDDADDVFLEQMNREDVSTYYKREDVVFCGWSWEAKDAGKYTLEMYVNEEWQMVFSWVIPGNPVINKNVPTFLVVDNFYEDPDRVRQFALHLEFREHKDYHKGKRTDQCYRFPGLKERFEQLLGCKIKHWENYGVNGCFQTCVAGDQLVYHVDQQQYAGLIFLTPNAPPQAGTSFFRSKKTHQNKVLLSDPKFSTIFEGGFLDSTYFDLVDKVGNVYNRLVIFNGSLIHSASDYFGKTKEDGRLFQLFFFDLE